MALRRFGSLTGTQGNAVLDAADLVQKNPSRIAAAADLNQDGRVDVIWQDPVTGASQAWFMGGDKGNQIIDDSFTRRSQSMEDRRTTL